MICDDCREKPASVHLMQIVNGQKMEMHLCFSCANRRNVQIWPLPDSPELPFKPPFSETPPVAEKQRGCQRCNYTWQEFMATGFLGCPKCYDSFQDLLAEFISKNLGNAKHPGKIPKQREGPLKIRREITELRNELDQAVHQENFEKAAALRDQIRLLEQQVTSDHA